MMPSQISPSGRIHAKNEYIQLLSTIIHLLMYILLKKKTIKLYNEAEVDSTRKSTSYIKLLQF